MIRTTSKRYGALVAVIVVAALATAGCSEVEDALAEADSSSTSPTPSPTPTPTPSPTRTETGTTLSPSASPSTPATTASSEATPTASPSATPAAPSGPPTSYDEAVARVAAAREAGGEQALDRFSTPGDAVYCVLRHEFIRPSCELSQEGAVRDPQACRGGFSEKVGRLEIAPAGAVAACNTDTIREPGAQVVGPTAVVTGGGLSCAVEELGVTCVHEPTASGFFLTPGEYAVLRS